MNKNKTRRRAAAAAAAQIKTIKIIAGDLALWHSNEVRAPVSPVASSYANFSQLSAVVISVII